MQKVKLVLLAHRKHPQYFPTTYVVQHKPMRIAQDVQRVSSKYQKCANLEESYSNHFILKICFHC